MPNPIVRTITFDGVTYDLQDQNAAPSTHRHGNITNDGKLDNAGVTIANRDALVVAQYPISGGYPIAKTSIIFDGSTTTKVLAKKGDWVDLPSGISPYTNDPEMDGTASAGSSTLYAKGDHVHPTDTSRAASSHTHGNITNGGDITATAPTIASGDQIIINDNSASKITNGPTFDGSTTTTALTPKGTWETFSKFSGSYNDLTDKPTIPVLPSNIVNTITTTAGTHSVVTSVTGNVAFNVPTKTSHLTNDSNFLDTNSTLNAAKLSGAIPSAVTATTQSVSDDSTKLATTAFVHDVVDGLPTPMQFIGTVGTDGTTTWANLPAASGHTGYTYKVITDHAAETGKPAAKVGDTIISNGTDWIVIPSGDEPSGTVTSVGITNGGGISVSGSPITSSGSITVSHSDTSSQASSSNSGRTYIQSVTLDTYGHVTGLSTATETVTDTNTTYSLSNALNSHKFTETLTAGGSGSGTSTATMEFAAGGVINLTDDTTNKKLTISISNANPYYVLAGPSSGSSAGAPSFRQLKSNEIIGYTNAQTQQNVSLYNWIQNLSQDIDDKVVDVQVNNTSVVGNNRVASIDMNASTVWAQFQDTNYLDGETSVDGALCALDTVIGSHTHTTTLATDTGTSSITLASAGKYKLTAGGTSVIFTMPTIPTVSYPVTSVNTKTGDVTLSASDVGALATTGGEVTGDLTLKAAAATNSPCLIFQRGTLSDNYNDWMIQDRSGYLYFDERGNGSTAWTNRVYFDTTGTIHGKIGWSDITGKPTIPVLPNNIVNTITTTAGAHTAITSATGDVSFSVPTKTSDLTNDGDGTSNFARMSDIGSLGGGTITKIKTTAGAHTAIDVSSGDAEFNVPTNTSHLTNDSGFVAPLIGTTADVTPTQVLTALQAGRPIYITYTHQLYGNIAATYFDYSLAFGAVVSNIVAQYNDAELGTTTQMIFELIGFTSNNTWQCIVTTIPQTAASSTTGISISDHSTTTIYGVSGSTSVYGVKSGTNSTTTASKVTLSGSDSFSATVSNHILSFSHSATTVSASDVTVPIRADSATTVPTAASTATTVVTSATHSITDNGHTHSLS